MLPLGLGAAIGPPDNYQVPPPWLVRGLHLSHSFTIPLPWMMQLSSFDWKFWQDQDYSANVETLEEDEILGPRSSSWFDPNSRNCPQLRLSAGIDGDFEWHNSPRVLLKDIFHTELNSN
jgi:hypothetical protein